MTEKKDKPKSVSRDSTVNVDVDADSSTERDVTVDRDTDVTVETSSTTKQAANPPQEDTADRQPHPSGMEVNPREGYVTEAPPDPDYVDKDWTVDYGGDPVHPTEIPQEGYTVPLPEPEAPPVEPEADSSKKS